MTRARTRALPILLVAAGSLAASSAAEASTAFVDGGFVRFSSGAGASSLEVLSGSGKPGVLFRDGKQPIAPGTGCKPQDGGVVCLYPDDQDGIGTTNSSPYSILVSLSDKADVATIHVVGRRVSVQGRGGEDELTTRAGGSTLFGGAGRDGLYGSPSADGLVGGPGSDTILPKGGVDVVDGGATTYGIHGVPAKPSATTCKDARKDKKDVGGKQDRDLVSFAFGYPKIGASLRKCKYGGGSSGNGGAGSLVRVEALLGTAADDVLVGDSFVNRLSGGGGDDLLHGAGGKGMDSLYGDDGFDTLKDGDSTANPTADYLSCSEEDDEEGGTAVHRGPDQLSGCTTG